MTQAHQSDQTQATIIGADTHLSGTLCFDGEAHVLGKIDGKIIGAGEVHIGLQALCRATIEAKTVIIDGTVEGNITAKEKVQLNASARVNGDIFAEAFSAAAGATFHGNLKIGGASAAAVFETKSQTPVASAASAAIGFEEPVAPASSSWATARPTGLGAGLSSLGTPRASWPNQR